MSVKVKALVTLLCLGTTSAYVLQEARRSQRSASGKDGGNQDGEGLVEEYIMAKKTAQKEVEDFYASAAPGMEPDPHTEAQDRLRQLRQQLLNSSLPAQVLRELLGNDIVNNTDAGTTSRKRTIEKDEWYRWPKGILPYVFTNSTTEDKRIEIIKAMKTYERFTCIRYVPWVNKNGTTTNDELKLGHPSYLKFVVRGGCWSWQGNLHKSAGQTISCCTGSSCTHELGHALGLYHEQQSPNPDRNLFIRVNYQYIDTSNGDWYAAASPNSAISSGYDMSSVMHYYTWMFRKGNAGPTFTQLYPELPVRGNHYYMMKEVSESHKCDELYCSGETITCENDGYLTVVDGKCGCRCIPGLDPSTGCTTVYKNDPASAQLPGGSYAIPQPNSGCPKGFSSGSRIHYNDGGNSKSTSYDLKGDITDKKIEQHFCVSTAANNDVKWPRGNYCIYRKGGSCPDGFTEGFVQYDDNGTDSQQNSVNGDLPDGVFNGNTRLEFCCRHHGRWWDELFLPSRTPFVLIKHPNEACHEIRGMRRHEQAMTVDNSEAEDKAQVGGEHAVSITDEKSKKYKTKFCYYTPAKIDCGDVINLSASSPTATFSSPAGADLECYWLIKAPNGESVQLDFSSFNVPGTPGKCKNKVEIRYVRPGQPGLSYCGDKMERSIRSINNTIHMRLSTFGDTGAQFTATVKLIQNADLCYLPEDRGTTYAGRVNFTRDFEPCLPWAKVSHCPYHPFNTDTSNTMLAENYCRNPDYKTGMVPWCYTNALYCERNYCDVCLLGKRFDTRDDCKTLKTEGICSREKYQSWGLKVCAKTCETELPDPETPVKASEITCNAPGKIRDSDFATTPKSSYRVGETVTYKCKYGNSTKKRVCLTSRDWSVLQTACDECDDGWHLFEATGNCYLAMKTSAHYTEAKAACSEFGAILSPAKTQEENGFITKLAGAIWIGITDEKEEGTWVFTDGSVATWTNWDDGQPDNYGSGEDCATIRSSGKWNDLQCSSYKYPFVCKKAKKNPQSCFDHWGKCSDFFKADPTICNTWKEFAERQCPFTCGHCGVNATGKCDVPTPPANAHLKEQKNRLNAGEHVTYVCNEGFVHGGGDAIRGCNRDGTLTGEPIECFTGCPEGWTYSRYTKHCYRYFNDSINYANAKVKCTELQGSLSTAKNGEEQNLLMKLKAAYDIYIWLGLDDIEKEGEWRWADGTLDIGWGNWYKDQPNDNNYYGQDCGYMDRNGLWDDCGCWHKCPYVCKVDLQVFKKATTSAPTAASTSTTTTPTTSTTTTTTTTTTAETMA